MYHLEGLRVPLMVRIPQFGNHCSTRTFWSCSMPFCGNLDIEHLRMRFAVNFASVSYIWTAWSTIRCSTIVLLLYMQLAFEISIFWIGTGLVVHLVEHAPPVLVGWVLFLVGPYLEKQHLRSVQPRARRWWLGATELLTRGAAIDSTPMQHSLRK